MASPYAFGCYGGQLSPPLLLLDLHALSKVLPPFFPSAYWLIEFHGSQPLAAAYSGWDESLMALGYSAQNFPPSVIVQGLLLCISNPVFHSTLLELDGAIPSQQAEDTTILSTLDLHAWFHFSSSKVDTFVNAVVAPISKASHDTRSAKKARGEGNQTTRGRGTYFPSQRSNTSTTPPRWKTASPTNSIASSHTPQNLTPTFPPFFAQAFVPSLIPTPKTKTAFT
ncbi:hypothetical protein GOP47_0030321 [Adiantum capillus-veneris]|nr:hypothetical protein GOP47_0030321 [Adiantum capillus-veneris]